MARFDAFEVVQGLRNREHNLARTGDGTPMMAYQGATPWHELGAKVESLTSVAAALEAAHLNWEAELRELFFNSASAANGTTLGGDVKVPDRRAVVRGDTGAYLGTVGPLYTPIQNDVAYSVFDDVCRDFGVTIESTGAIGNGALTWMLAKLPGQSLIAGQDAIDNYILAVNAHDGSRAHHARLTRERVVCQNTLAVALAGGSDFTRISHFKNAGQKVEAAKALVTQMVEAVKEQDAVFETLLQTRMTPKQVVTYIHGVLGIEDNNEDVAKTLDARRRTIAELVWAGKGADLAGSTDTDTTAWAAYNAVVEYFDHVRPAEAKSAAGKRAANESALWGAAAGLKLEAFKRARQLVAAA